MTTGPATGHRSGVVVRVSTVIAAPPAAVWSELERIEDHVAWMGDAVAIRFVGDQRRGVGTTFECDTSIGPFHLTDVMEVTGWEQASSISVAHRGPVGGAGRFEVTPGPERATTVRWEERLQFPWWWGGSVGAVVARPVLAAVWRANLTRLKVRIETAEERERASGGPQG